VWLSMHNARDPQMVKTYGPGDSFGELALLYDAPRAATIKVMCFSSTDGQP
jgi:CRP-like cAMP-binding protein